MFSTLLTLFAAEGKGVVHTGSAKEVIAVWVNSSSDMLG